LVNILATLKGLPLGYNRDLQETKPPAIKVSKELSGCLTVMTVAISSMTVNAAVTHKAASDPDMITTDLVEYLVNKGVPFRQAHEQVSALVAGARDKGIALSASTVDDLQKFSVHFAADALALFDPIISVQAKTSHGSTGEAKVKAVASDHCFPGECQ
jgi:argininosuccinate lyase